MGFATQVDLRGAATLKDHRKRAGFVVGRLKATTRTSQGEALALVAKVNGANPTSYWLANTLVVTGDLKLATLAGVSSTVGLSDRA